MLRVAERVSHSTEAAAVVSRPPHTRVLSLWDIGQVSKKYKHALVFDGCGVLLPAPTGAKALQRENRGIDDDSGRYDWDGAGL